MWYVMKLFSEDKIKVNQPIFWAFVGLVKAFDNVYWSKLFEFQKNDWNIIQGIQDHKQPVPKFREL